MAIDLIEFHELFFDECDEHFACLEALLAHEDAVRGDRAQALLERVRLIREGGELFGFDALVETASAIEIRLAQEGGGAPGGEERCALRTALTQLHGRVVALRIDPAHAAVNTRAPSKDAPDPTSLQQASASAVPPERYLTFSLGTALYAVAARTVREVRDYRGALPLPAMPAAVLGVTSVRGERIPVVDLRAFLGVGRWRDNGLVTQLIVNVGGAAASALIDAAEDVVALTIDPAGRGRGRGRAPAAGPEEAYVLGTARLGQRVVRVLDLERLMMSAGLGHAFDEQVVG